MATMMGLHCHDSITPGQMDLDLSVDEIVERRKLFRSLYIRERCYATARGTLRRLPRYPPETRSGSSSRAMSQDASSDTLAAGRGESPSASGGYDETNEPLLSMAMIQDELHAAMFPGNPPETRILEQKVALTSIRQKLTKFAKTHRLPSLKRPDTFQDLSVHLAYLGTRIRAYEFDDDEHNLNVLDDARLSCLLVISACSDENTMDTAVSDMLDRLVRRMALHNWRSDGTTVPMRSPGESGQAAGGLPTDREGNLSSPKVPNKRFWPFGADSLASPNKQVLRGQRVLELLPTSAIFILARNILRIQTNVIPSQQSSGSSGLDPTSNKSHGHELSGNANEDFAILSELKRSVESSLGAPSEAQNSYSSKLLRVVQTLVDFIRETTSDLPVQQPSSPAEVRHDMLDFNTHAEITQDGGPSSSTAGNAAEAAFMDLGTTWESPPGSSSLSFPFSPSFDLSGMNISSVTDSLFDFDFSQHFESVGGFMSPAEHLPDQESLRSVTEQEKRKKRLRLDCSQELDGPGDIMMSSWAPRNRATMRGSV